VIAPTYTDEYGLEFSITGIQSEAFKDCTNLKTLRIEDGVWINNASYAFQDCTGLTSIRLPNPTDEVSNWIVPEGMFQGCTGSIYTVTIPSGYTEIATLAFDGCTNISTAYIPDGMAAIRVYAFRNCRLNTLRLPYTPPAVIESNSFSRIRTVTGNTSIKRTILIDQRNHTTVSSAFLAAYPAAKYYQTGIGLGSWADITARASASHPSNP